MTIVIPSSAFARRFPARERGRGPFPPGGNWVPPTFLTVAEFTLFPTIVADPDLALDFSRVVHGNQEYEWRRHPRVGEALVARARIASIKERGTLGFLTIETEVADE